MKRFSKLAALALAAGAALMADNANVQVASHSLPNAIPGAAYGAAPAGVKPRNLNIPVLRSLTVTTKSLPGGTVGTPYNANLSAAGGSPPYSWRLGSGTLPAGISLAASGGFSGTPTTGGTASFNVRVTDADQDSATSGPLSIAVALQPVLVTGGGPLPDATVGVAYSVTLTAAGGSPPYQWTVVSGSLPPGLSLSAGGALTGIPTQAGNYVFAAQATDSAGTSGTGSFSLAVSAAALKVTTKSLPAGTVGAAYSQALSASGGTPPYTWSVIGGALPAGLNLSGGGQISGTPTAAGAANFKVQVQDSGNVTASANLSIAVNAPALSVTTSSLPAGTMGAAYSQTLSASGGTPPYTWSVTGGALPAGLNLSGGGQISGTPTAAGAANFTVQVQDSGNVTASANLSIAVNAPALSVTTSSLPAGTVGAAYSQTLSASGGTPPYTWSVTGGALPAGLSLSGGGQISGTPTAAGAPSFTVQAKDSANLTASANLSIAVNAPALAVTTSSLPPATVGTGYSQTLSAGGGTPPYTWSVAGGALPAGITLSSGGTLSGTPTAAGTSSFTAQVTDAASASARANLSITVAAPALGISTGALPGATAGVAYSQSLAASGGTPPYTWTITAGALPQGLSLSAAGTISGVPAAAGTASFTVQAADSAGATANKAFSIAVSAPALSITTTSLPPGITGVSYNQALHAAGGTPPYSWSIRSGALPAGLALSGNGVLSGTPTTAGSYSFMPQVTDSSNQSAAAVMALQVQSGVTVNTYGTLPGGVVGRAYSQTLSASGGTPPYTWSVVGGTLPPGLALSSSGTLAGTPTAAGAFAFSVQAADIANSSNTANVSLTVAGALALTTTSMASGSVGVAYSQLLSAAGGVPPYHWTVAAGTLPPGVQIDSASGAITGKPTAPGTFGFTAQVTDTAGGQASASLSIPIASGLTITTAPILPPTSAGASYSEQLTAVAGTAPYTWSVDSGALPGGLALSPQTGLLAGTPTGAGTFQFAARVTDAAGTASTKAFTLTVGSSLSITTAPVLPGGSVGVPYNQQLAASGGIPPVIWVITAGSLPSGVALDGASGRLSGTPAVNGSYQFTAQATDGTGVKTAKQFSLAVGLASSPTMSIDGPPDIAQPATQPAVAISLASSYPVQITGQLVVSFTPDAAVGSDDPAIQFATGGRTASFTIPAGATQASFSVPQMSFQSGTVAGTIQLAIVNVQAAGSNLKATGTLTRNVQVNPAPPAIRSLKLVAASSGFTVQLVGYCTSRQVDHATVQISGTAGSGLQSTTMTVPLSSVASAWYGSTQSVQYGSQFSLSIPFNMQGATSSAVASVTMTLSNSTGQSAGATATF